MSPREAESMLSAERRMFDCLMCQMGAENVHWCPEGYCVAIMAIFGEKFPLTIGGPTN